MEGDADVRTVPIENPRDHLISTAVKFLLNPRVRPTTLAQKQAFLSKKGLTNEEIEIACQKAGTFSEVPTTTTSLVTRPFYDTPRTSFWIKAKDVANMVALISIGSYSLYSFWKRYIAPRIFGTRSRQEQNYERLLASIIKLNESVVELKDLMKTIQQSQNTPLKTYELQEIKGELTAIKGLLLSRSQFPSSPGIPSWQMLESGEGENSNENSDENSSRRRKNKSERDRIRKDDIDVDDELGAAGLSSSTIRKHPSVDSNNGFHSGSSCEVVFVPGKNDSDPDHSDD